MTHPTTTCTAPQRIITPRCLSEREIGRLQQLCAISCAADGLAIPLANAMKSSGRGEKPLTDIDAVERVYHQSMVQMLEGITPETECSMDAFRAWRDASTEQLRATLTASHIYSARQQEALLALYTTRVDRFLGSIEKTLGGTLAVGVAIPMLAKGGRGV